MKNLTKVLLGFGVVGAVAATTYVITKKVQEKKAEEENCISEYGPEEADNTLDVIKSAATKKAVRILGWAMLHQQQIEAFAAIVSVGSAILSAATAIRDFSSGFKMQKQMNTIASQQEDIMAKLNAIHLDMGDIHQIYEALID